MVTIFLFAAAVKAEAYNYDFSAVNDDGVTIYYNIVGGNAEVTNGDIDYSEDVSIPSSVTNNGTKYSVTSIGEFAFFWSDLTSVIIPNSVTSIGEYAFSDCSSLISVTIPNSVTSIGGSAFKDCSSLTSVTIPEGITSIGGSAFKGCSSLTSVIIPGSVTEIKSNTFSFCSSLTSVSIPNSVTNIGYEVFRGCDSLTTVYSYITDLFEINADVFSYDKYEDATLYVQKGMKKAYASTWAWSKFTKIEEMSDEMMGISITEVSTKTKSYNLRGQEVKSPQRGIVIKDGKKVLVK